ncbi:membrane protein [Gordonia phage PCoral7]|uniref:Uncharacterized protein n=1 Tax=Gordonia phage Toast TaxID=2599852 RepID=A0A5J6TBZ4_9CAUD|nr:hypothetical protein JZX81_gp24 [Gordonia phage Toast]QFG08085.1 hypothetical protein PBI_TOAST_24 [Gordonia phage Toast]UVF60532.1 membrane protein [Gordonia phage PCoral7]
MIGARLQAAVLGVGQVTVGCIYAGPDALVRRPLAPGQVSAVVWIESFGPLWCIGFVATGLWLLVAAVRRKGFVRAHIGSAAMWAFFSGCVLISALLSEPPAPVVAGTMAGVLTLVSIAIARGDAERGVR